MKLLKRLKTEESGTLLILTIIFLMFGSLTVLPLLDFTATNLNAAKNYQTKTHEVYACDAGIEDAIQKLIKQVAPFDEFEVDDSHSYAAGPVNNREISMTVTQISLLTGLMGDDEYKIGQPHEGWLQFDLPTDNLTRNYEEDWVEYTSVLNFHYDGSGNRKVESVGAFFAPYPGEIITGPYDESTIPVMTLDNLESQEMKVAAGGFAFIYRWLINQGPEFDNNNRDGTLIFKMKVDDADWTALTSFAWATFKEQDVSYVTTAELTKWVIEADAGDTVIKAQVLYNNGAIDLLSWEIDPPD